MKQVRELAVSAALLAPVAAMAAAPDVTDVVTEIEGAAVPIGLLGSAALIVMIGIKLWKWMRRAT